MKQCGDVISLADSYKPDFEAGTAREFITLSVRTQDSRPSCEGEDISHHRGNQETLPPTSWTDTTADESPEDPVTMEIIVAENEPLLPKREQCGRKDLPPPDNCYVVYFIFYLLGIGSLLPWNFFSNARLYFMFKLRRDTNVTEAEWIDNPEDYTHLQTMFMPYLAMAAMIPNVLFMFLNTAVTKIMPLRLRIVLATGAMISMFALTVALTKIDTDSWQVLFFAVTMSTIVVMNAGSAVLQGGVFGLSGMFPKEYTQAVMGGMGMGGVIAAVANVLCIWLSSGPLHSGFGYFITAELVVMGALVGYLMLPCLDFARHHIEAPRYSNINGDVSETGSYTNNNILYPQLSLFQIFKKIWMYAVGVFFIFFITLSCYPAINSRIGSISSNTPSATPNPWTDTYFIPVTCFLLFNCGDLLGRTLAGPIQRPREKNRILGVLCFLRCVFVPLFLLCNVQPRKYLPLVFKNDSFPIVFMLIFSMSNGYLGTLCMMYGPRLVDVDNVEMAGAMMSFFLSLGLGAGSLFSFLLASFV